MKCDLSICQIEAVYGNGPMRLPRGRERRNRHLYVRRAPARLIAFRNRLTLHYSPHFTMCGSMNGIRSRDSSGIGSELLTLSRLRDLARVKRAALRKLADVQARIAGLERVRQGLATLIAACPGHGRPADCPILQALGGEDPP